MPIPKPPPAPSCASCCASSPTVACPPEATTTVGDWRPISACLAHGWAIQQPRGDDTSRIRHAAGTADPDGYAAAERTAADRDRLIRQAAEAGRPFVLSTFDVAVGDLVERHDGTDRARVVAIADDSIEIEYVDGRERVPGVPGSRVAIILAMALEAGALVKVSAEPHEEPVDWRGRRFGELTADEQRRASRQAAGQLQAELDQVAPRRGDPLADPSAPMVILGGPHPAPSGQAMRCDVGNEPLPAGGWYWLMRSQGRGWWGDTGAVCAAHGGLDSPPPMPAPTPVLRDGYASADAPDASGDTAERGRSEGSAWAATRTAAELHQAITAREATGYADGDGYNGAFTDALRQALAAATGETHDDGGYHDQ